MWWDLFIFGLIEGVTEFLPISSTGHLILAQTWLELDSPNQSFEVIIQLAAVFAVLIHYRYKIVNIFSYYAFKSGITKQKQNNNNNATNDNLLWRYFINLTLAFLPIAIFGLIFYEIIKKLFTIEIVAIMFIIGGMAIILIEYWYKNKYEDKYINTNNRQDSKNQPPLFLINNLDFVTYKQAMLIGLIQTLALIPGTSRAGASIMGGLLVGLDRKTSAEFSFLLAIPVVSAAAVFDLVKNFSLIISQDWGAMLFGFMIAFLTSLLVIKLLLDFLSKFSYIVFGVYRILFGIILFLVVYF